LSAFILPPISAEQQNIINKIEFNNVIIDSVAGGGKTSASLYIAKTFKHLNICLLTYNSALKTETRKKAEMLGLTNMEIHSYHSFAVKYYDKSAYADGNLSKCVSKHLQKNIPNTPKYDLFIFDESQDLHDWFFKFIKHLIYKVYATSDAKICTLGDTWQNIYTHQYSDERYLTLADKLFTWNNLPWERCVLSQSFRLTQPMCSFINKSVIHEERIKSQKKSPYKPRYLLCDAFNDVKDEILYYRDLGYKYSDIFCLASSVIGKGAPIKNTENLIKTLLGNDVLCYASTNEDERLDDDIIKNKLVFTTFHQAKGRERKVVIVFNFDSSYFEYYAKEDYQYKCPNAIFVALSRGSERLSVIHHYRKEYIPFLNVDTLLETCDMKISRTYIPSGPTQQQPKIQSVTDLLRHLNQDDISKCLNYVKLQTITKASSKINIPSKIKGLDGTSESVSDINGICLPSLFEYSLKGSMTIFDILRRDNMDSYSNYDLDNMEHVLQISLHYHEKTSGYKFKNSQVGNLKWMTEQHKDDCISRLQKLSISKGAVFEKKVEYPIQENKQLLGICGSIDCIDGHKVFEFKATDELQDQHYIQVILYMLALETERQNLLDQFTNKVNRIKSELLKESDFVVGKKIRYDQSKCGIIHKIDVKNDTVQLKALNNRKLKTKRTRQDIISEQNTYGNSELERLHVENSDLIKEYEYYLYNILTDELIKVSCKHTDLEKILNIILEARYGYKPDKTSDEQFLSMNNL